MHRLHDVMGETTRGGKVGLGLAVWDASQTTRVRSRVVGKI